MVLPAPDGPTSATIWPGSTVKLTSKRTWAETVVSRTATDSREARETSSAVGYRKSTWSNSMVAGPGGTGRASGASVIIGGRSSTSKTRSNETSAVMTSIWTLDSAVNGPYRRVR